MSPELGVLRHKYIFLKLKAFQNELQTFFVGQQCKYQHLLLTLSSILNNRHHINILIELHTTQSSTIVRCTPARIDMLSTTIAQTSAVCYHFRAQAQFIVTDLVAGPSSIFVDRSLQCVTVAGDKLLSDLATRSRLSTNKLQNRNEVPGKFVLWRQSHQKGLECWQIIIPILG